MATTNGIRLVCFDLGGVMIRICRSWREVLLRAAIPAEAQHDHGLRLAWVYSQFETGRMDQGRFECEMTALTGWTPQQTNDVLAAVLIEPYPGVNSLLDRLQVMSDGGDGLATACLSNTNAAHWAMMLTDGPARLPLERLHYRFASHLIGASKPDPAIYRHVQQVAGCEPGSILFFDDTTANVQGARECGWKAEIIDPEGDPVAQVADHLGRYGIEVPV